MGECSEPAGETGAAALVLARDEEKGGHAATAYCARQAQHGHRNVGRGQVFRTAAAYGAPAAAGTAADTPAAAARPEAATTATAPTAVLEQAAIHNGDATDPAATVTDANPYATAVAAASAVASTAPSTVASTSAGTTSTAATAAAAATCPG